ncbi:hypothetical protein SETIT_5G098700v2 [Setaria italica]|uniref:Uncharacterized protein n=1 Tax=Setaria italica TaxID=4555 RepID=A0A368R326_SETIT|nr:hypothetical protein SETIT_5G098700v2 [Setaria italica]
MPGGSIQRDRIDPSFLPFFHGGRLLQEARLTTDHAILLEASSSHYSILRMMINSYNRLSSKNSYILPVPFESFHACHQKKVCC